METVEAIASAPESGVDSLSGLVQVGSSASIREQLALDLTEFMDRNFSGVFINEAQSNPLQPDLRYRGFVASPLLGLPQGIAVYQDGVRLNEPFGDTVNWALLPTSAIDTVYVVPGSHPLFGLNSLGGSISIRTKSGETNPGSQASLLFGSNSRTDFDAEFGNEINDQWSYFFAGSYLEDDGWRDFSPTRASQIFSKLSYIGNQSSLDLSLTHAEANLIGNGAAPEQLLKTSRTAVFTRPDQTRNDLNLITATGTRELGADMLVTGTAYLRFSDIKTLNGDDSDFERCEDDAAALCLESDGIEEPVFDTSGTAVDAIPSLLGATINRTNTKQDGQGFSVQLSGTDDDDSPSNRWLIGATYDSGEIEFSGSTELGSLDSSRLAVPGSVLVGDAQTSLHADTSNLGVYAAYTVAPVSDVSVSISGRYNRSNITLRDQISTALDGDHQFSKFNPSLSVAWSPSTAISVFGSLTQSNRVPSPVELTCADDDDPCRLPNAFLSDPPLEQVIARTLEIGTHGVWSSGEWNASLFRTQTSDEILFISAGARTNEGFFDNVGDTRRQGIEVGVSGALDERVTGYLNLSLLQATFRDEFTVPSANHPNSIDGEIFVERGDRLPLVPERFLKAGINYRVTPEILLSANLQLNSGVYFRGDESNSAEKLDGFSILNVRASYDFSDALSVYLKIDNILDETYSTFGVFGEADEVLGEEFDSTRFVSPGAPRLAWIGIAASF